MRRVRSLGECIQCGNKTNIQLDCGKYACIDCLNVIGKETKNVRDYLETMSQDVDMKQFIGLFIETLCMMKSNNITTVDNIIKTLDAVNIYKEYQNGTISAENKEKIEKQLDIFYFL